MDDQAPPWILSQIVNNWNVIKQAPMLFISSAILGVSLGLAWNWRRSSILSQRLAFSEERVKDYKGKLDGASPADAAARIHELELQTAKLRTDLQQNQRRTLTKEQVEILRDALKGRGLQVCFNSGNLEAEEYARSFWGNMRGLVDFVPTDEVPIDLEGVFLRVANTGAVPARAHDLSEGLNKAGIPHEIIQRQFPLALPAEYCDLVIGRKRQHEAKIKY
jgi:hypothetical protein